ncbi:hypothetical protein LPJ73_000080 [Coemansia sp. RSA 2703]|nr:hypothetical protein LPJ73_000080 [Coemansia sp. RSA 2703]KAJ2398490.1 hypothetical protein GGI05_000046 [Coemansia sp. RSA 2603]
MTIDTIGDIGNINKEKDQKEQQPPPTTAVAAPASVPLLLPMRSVAAPQRAAMRPNAIGVFRSFSQDRGGSVDGPRPAHSPVSTKGHSKSFSLTNDDIERQRQALEKEEWESARMEELGQEIRKLLGPTPQTPTDIDTEKTDTERQNTAINRESAVNSESSSAAQSKPSSRSTRRMPAIPESESVLDGLDLSQPLNLYKVPDGIMQVFIMGIHPATPINRPYVVVRLGDQVFQTSVGKVSTGSWSEGFELIVSYHMQLFGTVHLDVYSSNVLLPDTLIGRAEIKISLLEGFPEIFTSYYEIWDKKLAASTVPEQRQKQVVSKNLGALQVRVNYRFQKLEDPEPKIAKVHGAHIAGTVPTQLVNQIATSEDPSSSVDIPIEDLVAAFANEYNQYMEMVRATTLWPHLRNTQQQQQTDDTNKTPDVGFAKVDDDGAPTDRTSSLDALSADKDATKSGSVDNSNASASSSGWFTDFFSNVTSTQAASTDSDNAVSAAAEAAGIPKQAKGDISSGPSAAQGSAGKATTSEKTLMQSLTSMFISPSTFMAFKSLDRLVGAFNQGVELSNTELLGGLLTLYKFYNEAEIPGVTRPHKGQIVESVQDLELPGRYAKFALASYGWRALYFFNRGITLMDGAKYDSDVTSVLQYLNLAQEDLLGYEFRSSQLFCPSYFVAYDRQHASVVLVVRGTMSAEDTVVDLSCEYSKWNGGLVHSGMKASAHWLFIKVMPLILAYAKSHEIKNIRIVGHSLGGSTAAILTIMVQSVRSRLSGLGIDTDEYDIKGYCYGPAPCVSEDIANRFRDCIETYVNNDDLVPRLCYGSVSDFKRMSINAADEADNLAQRLYAPFEDSAAQQQRWKERFLRLMKIREDIFATQENLHLVLPGVIHHIVPYRGATSSSAGSGKSKKEARNPDLDIAIGHRQLFGSDSISDIDPSTVDAGKPKKSHVPPPTPDVKVRSDSVDPEDLADAINTTIDTKTISESGLPNKMPLATAAAQSAELNADSKIGGKQPTMAASTPATPSSTATAATGSGERFYPVWIQKVPSDSFGEILLRPTLITDHMPSAYESAFARAIETQIRERRLRDQRRKSSDNDASNTSSGSLSRSSISGDKLE